MIRKGGVALPGSRVIVETGQPGETRITLTGCEISFEPGSIDITPSFCLGVVTDQIVRVVMIAERGPVEQRSLLERCKFVKNRRLFMTGDGSVGRNDIFIGEIDFGHFETVMEKGTKRGL